MIVGATIASMIAMESIRIDFSATPIGPCGPNIPVQAESVREQTTIMVRRPAIRNFGLAERIPNSRRLPTIPHPVIYRAVARGEDTQKGQEPSNAVSLRLILCIASQLRHPVR